MGVQLDITKANATAEKTLQSPARESASGPSLEESAAADLGPANAGEGGRQNEAHIHLVSSTENLLAGLRLLAPAEKFFPEASGQHESPQPRGEVGPQEKQMQRSVVGTVIYLPIGDSLHFQGCYFEFTALS